jgi:hypothetical protein
MGSVGGAEKRGLGNALSTISPVSGYETMLVPALLLPAEFGEPTFAASFDEISLAGEEKVSGKDCYVLGLRRSEGMELKLWVDKASYLIRRAFDPSANATMNYHPRCDIKIPESEFGFAPPQ